MKNHEPLEGLWNFTLNRGYGQAHVSANLPECKKLLRLLRPKDILGRCGDKIVFERDSNPQISDPPIRSLATPNPRHTGSADILLRALNCPG